MASLHRIALLGALPLSLVLTRTLWSYGTGALAGETGILGQVPLDVTRAMPGCGACHRANPGGNQLNVDVALSARSLTPGQSITVTTSATGGRPHPLNWGGFSCDADVGAFSAGTGTRVGLGGLGITHVTAFASPNRTWTYGYTAPATPGPVNMWANVNTVDGDGQATAADLWAFHGGDGLEQTPTPVRMFVNAVDVLPVGDSCVGSWENYPVLGARQQPRAGNSTFTVEVVGATPSSTFVLLIGTPLPPLDLTPIGVTGCTLHVNSVASVVVGTSGGVAKYADGTATVPLPIPNNARGTLRLQGAFVDPTNGRPLPLTVTNALDAVIR
ncbi:MAG: choice-of-anchor V domain-containing protein [Planctomycetota bacterium]